MRWASALISSNDMTRNFMAFVLVAQGGINTWFKFNSSVKISPLSHLKKHICSEGSERYIINVLNKVSNNYHNYGYTCKRDDRNNIKIIWTVTFEFKTE